MGDQDRFADPNPDQVRVMCYARDAGMLASRFGRTRHAALVRLKEAIDSLLTSAHRIDISCPLGTALSGNVSGIDGAVTEDVAVRRFPMAVPQPVPAASFSGKVALAHYLTPTGSRVYEPAWLALDRPVLAEVASGRIERFTGDPETVRRVRAHHDAVAATFDIDPDAVHSWHAGVHPGCAYAGDPARNPDRWSNTVFANPRFLHFHTCGHYAPGEICWMVLDPTITVDGTALWSGGRLRPEAFAPTRACLDEWPDLRALIESPSDRIGLPAGEPGTAPGACTEIAGEPNR